MLLYYSSIVSSVRPTPCQYRKRSEETPCWTKGKPMILRIWDCPSGVNCIFIGSGVAYLWKYNNSFRKCVWCKSMTKRRRRGQRVNQARQWTFSFSLLIYKKLNYMGSQACSRKHGHIDSFRLGGNGWYENQWCRLPSSLSLFRQWTNPPPPL